MSRPFEEEMWMTNKYMKQCSTSLAIKEMQSNTTMNYHYILIKTIKILKMTMSIADKFSEKLNILYILDKNVERYIHSGK